ncbi:hypothetical protein B484DRAFT_457017 [Ochromonadaceae sp. CCMP2298]|nr:hypothetical protein B484DRAFT_457017 [Ochromonadaceae sp. CCMP2298]|mmetsp:Transcript_9849/g.21930  ORF Transcript_9849/g.21930 Transcript_9849/m.21930 type:complete len:360 (+) Transcript_9849:26-1105(+)
MASLLVFSLALGAATGFRTPFKAPLSTRLNVMSIPSAAASGSVGASAHVYETSGLDTEHLISEEMVTDDMSASLLADRCIAEAKRLFTSEANWRNVEVMDPNIKVEVIPLEGEYAQSGVHLVRGSGIIPASAEKFFKFQISREGFQSIDEYLVNHRNVDNFKWMTRPEYADVPVPAASEHFADESPYQLMMNRVEWKYPMKRREFVALDIVDNKDMILISKSSLSPHRPGGSRYQTQVPMDEKSLYVDPVDPVKRPLVRAVQYYASLVEPIDENSCRLTMVTWGEMCDNYSAWWINLFNAHVFITPKFDRFQRVMGGESLFEESKIMDNAWRLLKIIPNLKADAKDAAKSDFVTGKKVV